MSTPATIVEGDPTQSYNSNFLLRALAACGDCDAWDVNLVEQFLTIDGKLRVLEAKISALARKRQGDEHFQRMCMEAFHARAELAAFQIGQLLDDWSPGLCRQVTPH